MINQDEVFVITEDDILKPADKGKGKGPRAVPSARGSRAADRSAEADETVSGSAAPSRAGRRRRNPAAASTLSLFLWGLGQLYNGDGKLAALFLLCELLILAFHYLLFMAWDP